MLIKNYNFTEKEISMIVSDLSSGQFIWLGYKLDDTTCKLKKVSANDPLQTYFDLDLSVNEIKKGVISGSYIYLALDDDTLIAQRYTLSNPLNTPTDFSIPAGITEAPIDILVDTYVYLLIPGNISGTNAKIVIMTTAGVYVETIDLPTVTNAKSFAIDDTGDIWVATYTSPASYVRVFPISGGYDYTVNY